MCHNLNPTPVCDHPRPIKEVLRVGFWNVSCPLPADEIGLLVYVTTPDQTWQGQVAKPRTDMPSAISSPDTLHIMGLWLPPHQEVPGFSRAVAPWLLPACPALGSPGPLILRISLPPHGLLSFLLMADCWRPSICSCLSPSPSGLPSLFFQLLLCTGPFNL